MNTMQSTADAPQTAAAPDSTLPRKLRARRKQAGVTMVELAVAVAVMTLIIAGAMVGVPRLMASMKNTQEIKDWQMAALTVQSLVMSGTLPSSSADLAKSTIVEGFTKNGTTVLNRFGGTITLEKQDGSGYPSSGIKVVSLGYPTAQCVTFTSSIYDVFSTLKINGQDIKSQATDDRTKINDACKQKVDSADSSKFNPSTAADLEFTFSG